ncbi:MAG: DUF2948 family protein [Aquisalinus sp.]|nr:DUF2948 family protein [Aquisalinus sp.]
MNIKNFKPLRLMAADSEDIEVLSACLQDAVMKVGDMAYLPKERRFAFVANRFVWEEGANRKRGPFIRVRTGIHFDDVTSVRARNIRQDAKAAVVSLLAVRFEPKEEGAGQLLLEFAGGGEIALEVQAINIALSDISDPWRTQNKPEHDR